MKTNTTGSQKKGETRQYSTFYIGKRMYGIDVMKVQEVSPALIMTPIPLAPKHVHGLINLRGQISTAICLRDLFRIKEQPSETRMNLVCRMNDLLVSFLVDRISDVIEVRSSDFHPPPENLPMNVRKFMSGVYKTPNDLLSILEVEKISEALLAAPAGDR